MASIVTAIDYVLRQEDSRLAGVVTDDARDPGGKTRFGLCQRFHPELIYTGFFDATRTTAAYALQIAEQTYAKEYGEPLRIADITAQQVANAIVSFAVNEGTATSVEILQAAVGINPPTGFFGAKTLSAVNNTSNVLSLLEPKQIAHYQAIVAKNSAEAAFLNGWLNRVKQDCEG